ncbi:TonB-dependent receptor plug domain-containing protein [Algicola sagamiensis]|uniref:TonB-dependent receptor plug domain-containing protein n=1 Tax=Algicola sagamiensis TaxID=163869 RepID=UPI0003A07853|nr:TonB-dependent receptor plug domain-containing protein [Algicola sagamiensis]
MFRLNPISSSMKMLAVSALAFNTIPNTAYANEASAEDESVERIQVTGTRILREGVVAPAPITVIGEDAIKASGATNLGDLLNSLPALGNTFSMSSSTNYIGTTGSNFLDLRRLGSNRTLVLIDGKRHVASDIGTARVDVNTIPTEWIKSVEVITGGASAVYGADAVSGVVNFILKDNIDGVHFSAQKSDAADSGFSDYKYAFSAGGEFANGKGNAAVSLEVAGQNAITQADRGHSSYSDIRNPNEKNEVKGENKIPDKLRVKDAGLHIYSDGGRFALDDGGYMFLPDGTFRKQKLGNLYDDFRCAGDCDWFDFSKGSTYQPEFKRITFNSKVNYDINDQASLYFHGKYSQTKATDHADWTFSRDETIQKDNAFASAELVEFMAKNNLESISIRRIHTDMGRRSEENIRQTSRFVSGLERIFP